MHKKAWLGFLFKQFTDVIHRTIERFGLERAL